MQTENIIIFNSITHNRSNVDTLKTKNSLLHSDVLEEQT